MPLVSPSFQVSVALAAIAACALASRDGEPAVAAPVHATAAPRGLRTDVRSQTGGATLGEVPTNMVFVPGGTFTMGLPEATLLELFKNSDNRAAADHLVAMYPEHVEQVQDLLVDKFEVSNLQYKTWLDAHQMSPNESLIKYNWISFKNGKPIEGLPEGQENLPIRAVSAEDSGACARWLGKRLPTEIEWEYVARRGLKKDQVYPWGSGFQAWDRTKCANSANAARGAQGSQTFAPGTWKEDVSVDGVFDLCGNVAEWTASPFEPYPGFQPLELKEGRNKRTVRGLFTAEKRVYRGGNYLEGNHLTNNLVYRGGFVPSAEVEVIGFRCVMSALPGFDQLRSAERTLTLLADIKGRLEFTPDAIAAQLVQYVDPESNVARGSKHFAFTRVTSIPSPILKIENDSVEKPALLAVFTTSTPVADPPLPPGSYGIFFRGKGLTEAQKKEIEAARKEKPDAKGGTEKGGAGKGARGSGGRKGEPAKTGDKAAGGGAKDAPPGDAKPGDGATPADGEAKGDASAEETAVSAGPPTLVDYPKDINVLLIKNEADAIVGWRPAKYVEQGMQPTRLTYTPGASSPKQASVSAGGAGMITPPRDVARIEFVVKIGTSNRYPRFELALEFEAGSFVPVEPPAPPQPAAGGRPGAAGRR